MDWTKMPGADFLQLDPADAPAHGLADWLTAALRAGVTDGRLPVGTRLPSTRGLADQLDLSRGVVVEAYQRLAEEGLVGGRRGGGTTVLATAPPLSRPPGPADTPTVEIDLSPGLPDLSAFPRQAWLRAERAALSTGTAADLGYGDPRGTPALRTALAGWLARSRGVRTAPGEVMVVNGVAQGLALLMQVLAARGTDTVGFEDPGSAGTRSQLSRWGMRVQPDPVDEHGVDVAALAGSGLTTVVVTPAHQFPTGVVLAADRRRALADWARAGGLVIEDDYDAEHRYDRPPVAALQATVPDRVAHLGSVSKTLAPALRLGWLLAPAELRDELIERKRWSDITSPALGQLSLAELITSGGFEKHLRLVRTRQRQRRDALLDALTRHLPQARVQGVAAGLHLLVTLPGLDDDRALAAAAREQGVAVHPLSWHRTRPGPPGLVIGYAATTPDRLHEAVRRLAPLVG
jgi:GntR family transcriptional regulator/MocR family aminotransferase